MNRFFRTVFSCVITVVILPAIAAAEKPASSPEVELLWPDGAPAAKGNTEADQPTITIYLPTKEKNTGTAVVICPSGGYEHLAMDHEGHQIAKWLNSLGVAGFILKYRHRHSSSGYSHPVPLQDAQRAVRMVRCHAQKWNVNPSRIGIIGFSAGGHLASTVGTHFDKGQKNAKDPIDRFSCRPDFMILLYPVISLTEWYVHRGSRDNLLGENPDKNLLVNLSNEKQVSPETPPAFLVHANDDKSVPSENSIYFYLALRKAKVTTEMHIYQKGGHGFGLGRKHCAVSSWPVRCADWMQGLGLLNNKNDKDKQK